MRIPDQLDIYRRTNNARKEAGQSPSAGDSPLPLPEILRFGVAKINDNYGQDGTYTVTEQWRNPQTAQWDDALAPAGCVQAEARDFLDGTGGMVDQLVPFWQQRAKGGEIEILVNVSAAIPNGVSGDILYNDGSKWVVLNKESDGKFLKLDGGIPDWDNVDELPSGVSGDVLYHNGTDWVKLSKGEDGQVLQSDSGLPKWAGNTLYDGWNKGDIIYWAGSVWQILPIGTDGQRLKVNTDIPWWADPELPSGTTGDVLYYNGTNWVVLNAGTTGDVLTMEGGTGLPVWDDAPSSLPSSSGKSQYMVLQLDASLNAGWNWVKAHG